MEAHLCSEESLQSPGGGYEGDKKTRDTTPPCCGGSPQGKGQSLGWEGRPQELQPHLPAYNWAFLQAEREHTLVNLSQKKPAQCETIGPCLPSALPH